MRSTDVVPQRSCIRLLFLFVFLIAGILPAAAEAATLKLTPATGVYSAGSNFTVSVMVDSDGKSINAAEGTISFNPKEVSVVSASRASSIFNLWVTEPSFSNSAGTISFSGGSPAGYTGKGGTVMTVTLRAVSAGTPKLNFSSGAVLANDGKGTNVLSGMSGATFTIGAVTSTPEPEVIEYVAPANTPAAPRIVSKTHPDQQSWYQTNTAELSWEVPGGVTAVRTLLDRSSGGVPTKVYENPLSNITLNDLPQGVSYFHLQFKNEDGWGKVTHYRLAVDSEPPSNLNISLDTGTDLGNPAQVLFVTASDTTSKVVRYQVKIDNADAFEILDPEVTGKLQLPSLSPGYHAVIVEAYDEAGNGTVGSFSFTIESFEPPKFTEYPSELGVGIIPVIKGQTRSEASVEIVLTKVGTEPRTYTVTSNAAGEFVFIPEAAFDTGVYELKARATDMHGAQSDESTTIKIAVQQPGLLRIGSLLVSVVSVIVSLLGLMLLVVAGSWYLVLYLRRFRRQIATESKEAITILRREFVALSDILNSFEQEAGTGKRSAKSVKSEMEMIQALRSALSDAERRVEKEVVDVDKIARGDRN